MQNEEEIFKLDHLYNSHALFLTYSWSGNDNDL